MAFRQTVPSNLSKAGGPGGRGNLRFTWRGGVVSQAISAGVQAAMEAQGARIAGRLRNELHRWPKHSVHLLAEESFAVVELRGGRRTLRAGSAAPYAVYHELGTANFVGHPQITQIMEQEIPGILPRISREVRSRIA